MRVSFKKRSTRKPRRIVRRRRVVRGIRANPQPIFTETFRLPENSVEPNTGGNFLFTMAQVPQLLQYVKLYNKYRILKASIMLLPSYAEQDQNSGEYNAGASTYAHGMSRFVHAIQDTPNAPLPASEDDVLQMNGCRIRPVRHKLGMICRPTPNLKDATGASLTLRGKYINFLNTPTGPLGPEIVHSGISYWYTQPSLGTTPQLNNQLFAYVKLTFQLADPR